MRIPLSYLGEARPVLANVRKDVRNFLGGADVFSAAVELVDVRDVPDALIEVDAQIHHVAGRHFRLSAFADELSALCDRSRAKREDVSRWIRSAAASDWGSALLLACEVAKVSAPNDRVHVLTAGATHWRDWSSVGARYTFGLSEGMRLNASPNGVRQTLALFDRELAESWRDDDEAITRTLADTAARE